MSHHELHPHTAVINRKQKNQAKQARQIASQWLMTRFPLVFDTSSRIKPLKKGIINDILQYESEANEAGISRSKLRQAVAKFTRSVEYLACLKSRGMRVDLNGAPVEEVTDEEAERAALKIRKRVEKSTKNTRRILPAGKVANALGTKPSYSKPVESTSYYSDRHSGYNGQYTTQQPSRSASIVVKRKTTRSFDPNAVARLKEKLGLPAKAADEVKETE